AEARFKGPARMHRFRPVGLALAKVTEPHFRAEGLVEATVLSQWPAIVGERLARFSAPERVLADGTLRLRVTGGAALEIQHLEPQILERLASHFGYRALRRLVLVQGPLPARPEPPTRPARRALEPEEAVELEGAVGSIGAPGLKSALAALGRAVIAARPRGGR
ncbi:MAG TPA: DciA family protein, partial [Alphaproteobacteria bacterium]|nr:DciA family protein [Alphaproteobacteria bacterium]